MKTRKRVLTAFLCSVYILSSVLSSYVSAYAMAIPYAYSSYEVLEMIFLSFGITFDLASNEIGDETLAEAAIYEVETFFESWMNINGFDNPAQLRADLEACIETGRSGVISISDELWGALKGWAADLRDYYLNAGSVTSSSIVSLLSKVDTSNEIGKKGVESFCERLQFLLDCGNSYIIVDSPANSKYYLLNKSDFNRPSQDYRVYNGYYQFNSANGNWYKPLYAYLHYAGNYYYAGSTDVKYTEGDVVLVHNSVLPEYSDIIWPEQNLAYDLCYLPNIELDKVWASGSYDVVTHGRTWDGTDVAGDVIITFPEELGSDIPFQDLYDNVVAGDIPYTDALTGAGVIAVDTDKDAVLEGEGTIAGAIVDTSIGNVPSIDDTKEEVDENGNTVESNVPMTFDLSKLFPFCIPFDIIAFLSVLVAEPEAPCITWPIQYPTLSGMQTYNLEIDLSQFDGIAQLLRTMETLVFIVGLAGITRNHMIRG